MPSSVPVQRQGQSNDKALTVVEVKDELEKIRPQLIEVLPQRMDPDRFLRVVAGAVLKSPKIMAATRTPEGKISLFRAILDAGQLGLEPTGLLGSAYLVPYGNTIQL